MYFKSKKISLLILAVTALVLSRPMFTFFNDPEGTNLLVTVVAAAFVYFLSLTLYLLDARTLPVTGFKRLLLTVLAQVVIVIGLYLCLK